MKCSAHVASPRPGKFFPPSDWMQWSWIFSSRMDSDGVAENPKLPKGIYVGVLTAWSGGDYRQRMSDLGCRDFLFKPFGVELLPSFLQRAMRERRRNGTK